MQIVASEKSFDQQTAGLCRTLQDLQRICKGVRTLLKRPFQMRMYCLLPIEPPSEKAFYIVQSTARLNYWIFV